MPEPNSPCPRRGKCLTDPELRGQLKACMKRAHLKGSDLATLLDLSRNSFYNKLEGSSPFTLAEVAALALALHLSCAETCRLFLSLTPDEERRLHQRLNALAAPSGHEH